MFQKSSSFKTISLLVVLCFTGSILLPIFTPEQEAEACLKDLWDLVSGFASNAGWDIVKEATTNKQEHKPGVDPNGSHGEDEHSIVPNPNSSERYRCDQCDGTARTQAGLETDKHKKIGDCKYDQDPVGCRSPIYNCHKDKASHSQTKTCSVCGKEYRGCVGGHDDCSNNDSAALMPDGGCTDGGCTDVDYNDRGCNDGGCTDVSSPDDNYGG